MAGSGVGLGGEIHHQMLFEDLDARMLEHPFRQGAGYRLPGGIGGVEDAAVAVPPLPGQVMGAGRIAAEFHSLADQPGDGLGAAFYSEGHHVAMAESGPCDQGILLMELVAVIGIDHCGNAPLRVGRRAGLQMSLAQQGNAAVVCQLERQGHAGGAAADDQHVVMEASVVHGEEGAGA